MKRNLFKRKLRRALAASLGAIAFSSSAFVVNAVSELDIYRHFNSPAFDPDSLVIACVGFAPRNWSEAQAQQAAQQLDARGIVLCGQPVTFVVPQVNGQPQIAGNKYDVEVHCGPVKIPARLVANELSTNLHLAAKDDPNNTPLQNGPDARPVGFNWGMLFGNANIMLQNNTNTKNWAKESWRVALAKKEQEKAIEDDKKAAEKLEQQKKQEELNRKKLMTGPQETTQKKNNINTNTLLTNFSAAAAFVPVAGAAIAQTAQTMIPTPNMPETTIPQKN